MTPDGSRSVTVASFFVPWAGFAMALPASAAGAATADS